MRPDVVHRRAVGTRARAWHKFVDGSPVPVCGVTAKAWTTTGRFGRMHVHGECKRLCPWEPRLNAVMTEEQIAREAIDGD